MADKTVFDKLLEWYSSSKKDKGELQLSEDEQVALARWEMIDDLNRRHRPALRERDIKNMVMEAFGISERQYYYDKQNTQRFFGTFNKTDKDYMISVQVEWYKQIRSLAEAAGDYMAAVAASKQLDKLLRLEETEVSLGELIPTTIQLVLNLHGANGDKTKVINIDELQKLPDNQFEQAIEAANQLTISPEEMEKLLTKNSKDAE